MLMRCAPSAMLSAAAASTLSAPPASDTAIIQERVLTEFGSIKSRGLYAVSQPDQRCLAPGDAITSVRKKTHRVTDRTQFAAVDGFDPGTPQAAPSQFIDIGQPFAWRVRYEGDHRARVIGHKSGTNLIADFKSHGTNGRSEPGEQFLSRDIHRLDGRFKNATKQPTPPGVRGSNDRTGAVAKEDRQAISRHDRADKAGLSAECRIGFCRFRAIFRVDRSNAVNLSQPQWFSRQVSTQRCPICCDMNWIVTDMIAKVLAVPW